VQAALGQHGDHELRHGVLGGLGREDPDPGGLLVHVEGDARDVVEGPLVVLRLESQIALDEDEEARRLAPHVHPDPLDVAHDQIELALRVCGREKQEGQGAPIFPRDWQQGQHLCSPRGCRCR
jgi:hypothetical protein